MRMLFVGAVVASLSACPRPPVGPPPGDPPPDDEERGVVNLPIFQQDRPAIGGKWYEYNVDGHILEPKDEAWIVKHGDDVAGFRITGVYDDDTGDSGVFHLDVVQRLTGEADGWSDAVSFVAPGNVKDGDPICVDLQALQGVACDDDAHDLRFNQQSRLSVFAAFAVAEPAIFLHDDVRVARFDGVALADLPDPATVDDLAEEEAAFDSTDWDFSAWAPDLPRAGRALGSLARVEAGEWALVDGAFNLVRFTVASSEGGLTFSVKRAPIEREDLTAPLELPVVGDVAVSLASLPVFVSFQNEDLLTTAEDLAGTSWPQQPPKARLYDLVVVDEGNGPEMILSPGVAVLRLEEE